MNAEDFKERTKRFAIKIIQFVELIPRSEVGGMFFLDNYSEPEARWVPTTDRRAGPDLAQSLLPRWESLKRNAMNPSTGWNSSLARGV
jgi:hypothetical protein